MCPLKNHIILEINTSDVTMTKCQQVNLFKTRHELVPVRDEGLKTGRKMGREGAAGSGKHAGTEVQGMMMTFVSDYAQGATQ